MIPVFDHGFLYGEGIYETLRTYDGEPFLFDRHMRRLRASASMIHLDVPISDGEIAASHPTMEAAGSGTRRSVPPIARHARRRRAHVRSCGVPPAARGDYREAARGRPERGVRARRAVALVEHRSQSPRLGESDHQVQQPAEQLAGDAGGLSARRLRRGHAQLSRRTRRMHDRQPVRRARGRALTPPLDAGLLGGLTREFVFEVGGRWDRSAGAHPPRCGPVRR